MLGSHKNLIILDAPSYEAAGKVRLESRLISWNPVQLAQAYPPEEALALTMGEQ